MDNAKYWITAGPNTNARGMHFHLSLYVPELSEAEALELIEKVKAMVE